MALVFPSNPSVNDTYQVNGRTYVWNGTSWRTVKGGVPDVVPTLSVDNDFSAGGTLHIDSTNNEIGIGTAAPSHQLHLTQDLGVDGNLIVGGTITVPTPVAGTNDTKVATTAFVGDAVSTAVSGLLDGAPAALDTLNELAAALDDDASYAATITNALSLKLDSSSYTAADVLSKLLTVDGAGSSLDADTLDGSHASAFAASAHTHSYLPLSGGTLTGNLSLRSANNAHDSIYRVGGIYFTWDSDSYGTNDHHSIRSTNGDTWTDAITINSFGNVRINIDSNGNGGNTFSIGRHTTGTGNELLTVDESGNIGVAGYVESAGQIRSVGVYNASTPATNDLIHCATSAYQYRFFRSTSVRASKKDIEPLDDAHADLLLQAQPVWYRSAMPQDDDRLSYYGFIAEDMAELDPRFANWGVSDDCQCTEEQLATYEHTFDHPPECVVVTGIPYERLTAHLTNLVQRQHARIESLESRIATLEAI